MNKRHLCVSLFIALLLGLATALYAVSPTNLRCEYRENPFGIDVAQPRLSWMIESAQRGERQTAYQVLVASSPALLARDKGDLWDSGKVKSDQSVAVRNDSPYGTIVSNWRREGNKLTMEVTIPANATATVYVPTKDAAGVMESRKPAAKAKGVKFLRTQDNAAVFSVGSGTYRFQSTLPEIIK